MARSLEHVGYPQLAREARRPTDAEFEEMVAEAVVMERSMVEMEELMDQCLEKRGHTLLDQRPTDEEIVGTAAHAMKRPLSVAV